MTRVEEFPAATSETTHLRLIVDNARPGFPIEIRETLEALGVNFNRVYQVIESHRFDYLLAEIDNADDELAVLPMIVLYWGSRCGPTPI